MAKYEYRGTVVKILPVTTYGKQRSQKREFWCKEPPFNLNSKWESKLPFVINYDPTSDKYNNLGQLDNINIGDEVKFSFTMRGREWTNPKDNVTRLFVDNKVCSKIEVLSTLKGTQDRSLIDGDTWSPSSAPAQDASSTQEDDDMPF